MLSGNLKKNNSLIKGNLHLSPKSFLCVSAVKLKGNGFLFVIHVSVSKKADTDTIADRTGVGVNASLTLISLDVEQCLQRSLYRPTCQIIEVGDFHATGRFVSVFYLREYFP